MAQANWQKVKEIFVEIIQQKPGFRQEFIEEVCDGDTEIRREVESLLCSYDSADSFMETPAAFEIETPQKIEKPQCIKGQTLSHYKIIKQIGTGGMGEVYLAQDTKLHRKIALKVLNYDLSSDRRANERLLREARLAATLDHPNICAIHEIAETLDFSFIIMQFVEGETLADKLGKERLSIENSLDLAVQIADALDEAHSKRIIHRDIKPANIIVNDKGHVKVLDFGLAKIIETENAEETVKMLSRPGEIMGTAPYMSPEQLRGEILDARTDIFSFGAMLYEILSGKQPFTKESNAQTIAAILKSEPPPLGQNTPLKLQQIVKKALQKNADKRYQNVKDLLLDLKEVKLNLDFDENTKSLPESINADPTPKSITSMQTVISTQDNTSQEISNPETSFKKNQSSKSSLPKQHFGLIISLGILVITLVIGFGSLIWWQSSLQNTNLSSSLTVSKFFSWKTALGEDAESSAHFSPDGKLVAFASTRNGASAIWLKQVSSGEPFTPKKDKWSDRNPIFSPDGERIAFISEREGKEGIWIMPTLGGTPELLLSLPKKELNLLRWSKDGKAIYYENGINVFELDLKDKRIKNLTNFEKRSPSHQGLDISPDGKIIAYVKEEGKQSDIWIMPSDGGNSVRITNDKFDENYLVWHPDGQRILYSSVRNDIRQIFVVGIDGSSPVQIIFSDRSNYVTNVSPNGKKILYYSTRDDSDLWKVSLSDYKETRHTEEVGIEMWADISPDSSAIVFQGDGSSQKSTSVFSSSILVQNSTDKGESLEITNDGLLPKWSPDGESIAFLRWNSENGKISLWAVSANGGEEKSLTKNGIVMSGFSPSPPFNRLASQNYQWLSDNRSIIYCARRNNISNLWKVSIDASYEEQLTQNIDETLRYYNPISSPDNKRIVFLTHQRKEKKWGIWIYEEGKVKLLLKSKSVLGLVGWTEDGQNIIIRTIRNKKSKSKGLDDVELLQVSTGDGSMKHLAQLQNVYMNNISLSPDRQMIAYVTQKDGADSINITSSRGKTTRLILSSNDPRVYFASLTWAPDSKSIYFSKQAKWLTISMIDNFK